MKKVNFETFAFLTDAQRSYSVEIFEIKPQQLEYCIEKEYFDGLCKSGCPNYKKKWSCPPFAPQFTNFVEGWDKLFVLYFRTDMEQYHYIKNDYLKIKAANIILKSRADKFLRKMTALCGSYISTGSCRLCRPCKCKIDLPCARPEIMTYSFEALGINVSQLADKFFQKPLLWYKPYCLPEYTSVVCGLLTNAEIMAEDIQREYLRYITS